MLIIIVFENHSKTELAVALVVEINDFQHHSIQRVSSIHIYITSVDLFTHQCIC